MLPKQPKAALAVTALALLTLSACGGGENTASPASPSAAASSSASASASATASVEASPSESTAYSGGSKAPAGEYRPADEHGPAQNVPKPKAPEGMNVETLEGLEKFIGYWNDMRNYALQTGDVLPIRSLVDDSYTQEEDYYDSLQEIYSSGGWIVGGTQTIHYQKEQIHSLGDGHYSVAANFEAENMVLWFNNEARVYDNSMNVYRGIDIGVQFKNGHWTVLSADEVN